MPSPTEIATIKAERIAAVTAAVSRFKELASPPTLSLLERGERIAVGVAIAERRAGLRNAFDPKKDLPIVGNDHVSAAFATDPAQEQLLRKLGTSSAKLMAFLPDEIREVAQESAVVGRLDVTGVSYMDSPLLSSMDLALRARQETRSSQVEPRHLFWGMAANEESFTAWFLESEVEIGEREVRQALLS